MQDAHLEQAIVVSNKMKNASSLGCNLTGNVHIQYQHYQHPFSILKTSYTSSPLVLQSI